jgi:hypothetical protein
LVGVGTCICERLKSALGLEVGCATLFLARSLVAPPLVPSQDKTTPSVLSRVLSCSPAGAVVIFVVMKSNLEGWRKTFFIQSSSRATSAELLDAHNRMVGSSGH